MDRDVLLGLDSLGTDEDSGPLPGRLLDSAAGAGAPGTLGWEASPPSPLLITLPLLAHPRGFQGEKPSEAPPGSAGS